MEEEETHIVDEGKEDGTAGKSWLRKDDAVEELEGDGTFSEASFGAA